MSVITWLYNNIILNIIGLAFGNVVWSPFAMYDHVTFVTIKIYCLFALFGIILTQVVFREKT